MTSGWPADEHSRGARAALVAGTRAVAALRRTITEPASGDVGGVAQPSPVAECGAWTGLDSGEPY